MQETENHRRPDHMASGGRKRTRRAILMIGWVGLMIGVLPGCTAGIYQGLTLSPPASKVLLFEIEGFRPEADTPEDTDRVLAPVDGAEFTRKLATTLNAGGLEVVEGSQFGDPADLMTAAKWARDVGAQAFITGKITNSNVVNFSQYAVHASFDVYDAKSGDHIGGISDAASGDDAAPLVSLEWAVALRAPFASKGEDVLGTVQKERVTSAKSLRPVVVDRLAQHVGRELCRGLGAR